MKRVLNSIFSLFVLLLLISCGKDIIDPNANITYQKETDSYILDISAYSYDKIITPEYGNDGINGKKKITIICGINSNVKNLNIPYAITVSIHCSNLKYLNLGKNINKFYFELESLENIELSKDNKTFKVLDNVIYSYDMSSLLFVPNYINKDNFIIPDSVKLIDSNAFSNNKTIEQIIFNESLEKIGSYAFAKMERLESIKVNAGLKEIGAWCFAENRNLKSASLECQIEILEDSVFYNCFSLEKIYLENKIKEIHKYAFGDGFEEITKKVYFKGTQAEWDEISKSDQLFLNNVEIICQNS